MWYEREILIYKENIFIAENIYIGRTDISYETFPVIRSVKKYSTVEEIVGIPNTMELLREVNGENEIGLVWRESDWQKPKDLSFNSFLVIVQKIQ